MYVELVLSSIATYMWWYSQPGYLLNNLCLNVMFVCSVSTLMFNANPLLRYDGYYILADITEIPNLRQKATTILSRKMSQWFLGMEQQDDPFLPERKQIFFALYSVAAALYRWFVVFSILFFLYKVFEPYRLEVIGQIIGICSLWGLLGMPLWQVGKFFYVPGRLEKVKKKHMYASLAGLIAILAAIFFIPLPHSVMATFEIQPHGADPVYVDVPEGGRLTQVCVKAGDEVREGKVLASLENYDLKGRLIELEGKAKELKVRRDSIVRDSRSVGALAELDKSMAALDEQLHKKRKDQERLTLKARRDGTVLPPPMTPKPPRDDPEGQLPGWWGTPMDERNSSAGGQGAWLKEGTLFCQIGDPRQIEAILIIDQADIEFVDESKHQVVDLKFESRPHETLHGKIEKIAISDLKITPHRLTAKAGGALPSKQDPGTGVERPQSTSYQAQVPLTDDDGLLLLGLRGEAKIHTDSMSLGARIWRFAIHTFRFKL
jgi:putative peptide zinc metalloprotease protein